VEYYKHTAEKGDVGAMVQLGKLYFHGSQGVPQSLVSRIVSQSVDGFVVVVGGWGGFGGERGAWCLVFFSWLLGLIVDRLCVVGIALADEHINGAEHAPDHHHHPIGRSIT
jgi:hypothetical protein